MRRDRGVSKRHSGNPIAIQKYIKSIHFTAESYTTPCQFYSNKIKFA